MLERFSQPDSEFRGMPFWAWNSKLQPEELRRQIGIFRQMGFGGFFMHARVGLSTEYLGKEWFDCIRICCEEARKFGMQAWLYDEDRWPSGAAGGMVTRNDQYKMKDLRYECVQTLRDALTSENTLAFFIVSGDLAERTLKCYRRIEPAHDVNLQDGESLLRFYWKNEARTSWFNGETYLDTMNAEAVSSFIAATHEAYKANIGELFGQSVPGIFTDEPCFSYADGKAMPWTLNLPGLFRKEYGFDLLDHLPELFFQTAAEVSLTRWAFFNLATKLFVNSFAANIGQWCKDNNLALTGHVLGEDTISSQAAYTGAPMRFYEHMQQPGIDLLTEHWNIFTTVKQCVSAARQLGRPRRLSESYACTGWDFSLAGHKALGDWQYALGINFLCKHLAWYSMEGEAKRDYPASISCQSPWHSRYHVVEDYFARIGSVISGGNEIRDLLFVHPIESYWATDLRYTENLPPATRKNDHAFEWLTQELLAEKLDFDYGDEEIMSRLGKVKDTTLCIGEGTYRAVLLPELKTIRSTTLRLLKDFAQSGGLICHLGRPPQYVDARHNTSAQEIYSQYFTSVTNDDFVQVLSPASRRIAINDGNGSSCRTLLYHLSGHHNYTSLFICNFGKEFADEMMQELRVCERTHAVPSAEITLGIPYQGRMYELNPENGKIHSANAEYSNGAYRLQTSFAPLAARLFIITEDVPTNLEPEREELNLRTLSNLPEDGWDYAADEPNVLVLDHADCYVDGKRIESDAFILQIDSRLRQMLNLRPRGEAMVQPWCRNSEEGMQNALALTLEYTFSCTAVPENCFLVLEHPEIFQIKLNDCMLHPEACGWWVDKSMRKTAIPPGMLHTGKNTLVLSCRYHGALAGLENIYLLGDFAVFNDCIGTLPEKLALGDWCTQGFPYFSGNLTYYREFECNPEERTFLSISDWRGSLLGIRINSAPEKLIAWPPEQLEITSMLHKGGKNKLAITVYSSRRNSFGPFYLNDKWPKWTGSAQFSIIATKDRQSVPCGLFNGTLCTL